MFGVAEAEEGERGGADVVGPDGERRDPDAAADEDRAAALAGRPEAFAERAEDEQLVALVQLAQAVGARADVLEQEVERPVVVRSHDAERARQERPLVVSRHPSAPRR